ncbi:cytochrome c oxidase assembly protein, partial [Listeria monocytogenes]|uniref:cytochrome c oxidase assembly protein n=1 Tax=Listeria monocytogenes TaxID=1639 RepID=UPI00313DB76E
MASPLPRWRALAGAGGVVAALAAVAGPLAEHAHHDFAAHALTPVLLGMLAPLLLSLARPLTRLLRALPVP